MQQDNYRQGVEVGGFIVQMRKDGAVGTSNIILEQ